MTDSCETCRMHAERKALGLPDDGELIALIDRDFYQKWNYRLKHFGEHEPKEESGG